MPLGVRMDLELVIIIAVAVIAVVAIVAVRVARRVRRRPVRPLPAGPLSAGPLDGVRDVGRRVGRHVPRPPPDRSATDHGADEDDHRRASALTADEVAYRIGVAGAPAPGRSGRRRRCRRPPLERRRPLPRPGRPPPATSPFTADPGGTHAPDRLPVNVRRRASRRRAPPVAASRRVRGSSAMPAVALVGLVAVLRGGASCFWPTGNGPQSGGVVSTRVATPDRGARRDGAGAASHGRGGHDGASPTASPTTPSPTPAPTPSPTPRPRPTPPPTAKPTPKPPPKRRRPRQPTPTADAEADPEADAQADPEADPGARRLEPDGHELLVRDQRRLVQRRGIDRRDVVRLGLRRRHRRPRRPRIRPTPSPMPARTRSS